MPSEAPEYLICLECETPCYTFEFSGGLVTEVQCLACGEDDLDHFATEEEFEALASAG